MKKVELPIMIQDPMVRELEFPNPKSGKLERMAAVEGYIPERSVFLDGPVSRRVAILDFDHKTGKLNHGVRFNKGKKIGWYENSKGEKYSSKSKDYYEPGFMQVSLFATILRTMDIFEKTDTLGRKLHWAFDGPQLFAIPRAGIQANAFYCRDSYSLEFYYFPSGGTDVFACLSRDIVAHETGHAIVDGIVPDLFDACAPQSLAIHEAMADLTAMLVAFSSHNLRSYLLWEGKGSIARESFFTSLAEEFGKALGHETALRLLNNEKSLDPASPDFVEGSDPHYLSEPLSGALYQVMVRIHEGLKAELSKEEEFSGRPDPIYSASGKALYKGAERFKRMVFRALDYLPPGEISFSDYGRALMAVDLAAYPDDDRMRTWVREQFLGRRLAPDKGSLEVRADYEHKAVKDLNLQALCSSDWAAYQFANANRAFLGIPPDIPFVVRPRLLVRKKYDQDQVKNEIIFKVSWDHQEDSPEDLGTPRSRLLKVGSTLVIDEESGRVLSRLTNAPEFLRGSESDESLHGPSQEEYLTQKNERDLMLRRLVDEDSLRIVDPSSIADTLSVTRNVRAEVKDGVLRFRRTGNMLH